VIQPLKWLAHDQTRSASSVGAFLCVNSYRKEIKLRRSGLSGVHKKFLVFATKAVSKKIQPLVHHSLGAGGQQKINILTLP
jgi:hypothetical protein